MSFVIIDPQSNFISTGSGNDLAEKVIDVSKYLKHNIPGFIKEDYPLFVKFLEAYYEFLEQKNQVLFESKKAIHYQDIDRTLEEFVEYFRKEFMVDIPKNILADKRTLLKNIRQFYRARGSEKSFRLLFRILYGTEIDFYYPREDILKTSDGKWIQEKSMKLRIVSGNAFDLISREICGSLSGAKAIVENVVQYNTSSYTVFEVFLSPLSISGTFLPYETLSCGAGNIVAEIYPVITGMKIQNQGELYEENEEVYFSDITGTGAKGRIKTVTGNGGIRFVEIESSGVNYSPNVTPLFPTKAEMASGEVVIGTIFTYPGYYLNEDGQLSTTKYLQDSYFYQQFSYVIFASESVERFRDIVSKILHPCGLILFGGLRYTDIVDGTFEIIDENQGHSTFTNQFRFFISASKNIEPYSQKQLIQHVIEPIRNLQSYNTGAALRNLNRFKGAYLPAPIQNPDASYTPYPMQDYWKEYGNLQIKDIGKILLKDLFWNPWKTFKFQPDPFFNWISLNDLSITTSSDFVFANSITQNNLIEVLPDRTERNFEFISDITEQALLSNPTEKENLLPFSEEFENVDVIKNNVTVEDNFANDPINGLQTVSKITENSDTSIKYIRISDLRVISGKQYIIEGYAKAEGRNFLRVEFNSAIKPDSFATFNLNTKAVFVSLDCDYANVSDETGLPTGWVKFTIAVTASANVLSNVTFYISDNKDSMSYLGNGTSGILLSRVHCRRSDASSEYIESNGQIVPSAFKTKKVGYFSGTEIVKSSLVRRNLLDYSNEFENIYWTKLDTVTITGNLIENINAASGERLSRILSATASEEYFYSISVKGSENSIGQRVRIQLEATNGTANSNFTETVLTNEFQRISVNLQLLGDNTQIKVSIQQASTNSANEFHIENSQVELERLTQYQNVSGTTVEYDTLGTFSNINSSTVFAAFESYLPNQGILLRDTNNIYRLRIDSGKLQALLNDGSVKTVEQEIELGKRYVAMIKYSAGNVSLSLNGNFPDTIAVGNLSNTSGNIEIGQDFVGKIARIIFNKKVPQNSFEEHNILQTLMLQYGII